MAVDEFDDSNYLHEMASSLNGDRFGAGLASFEILRRVELNSAYVSEKLLNLEILLMQAESKAGDYQGVVLTNGEIPTEYLEMAFQFDMISGILTCEAQELGTLMALLQMEIVEAQSDLCALRGLSEESVMELKDKLRDAEVHLKQSQDQVVDIKMRAAKFARVLSFGTGKGENVENIGPTSDNSKWKLQNAEHQRIILQLYEKSLAKELDLEKKLSDSRNVEGDLKTKLGYLEHEFYNLEDSMGIILERMFCAENSSELLLQIAKEMSLKLANQLNLEVELKNSNAKCITVSSEESALMESVRSYEAQLREAKNHLKLAKTSSKTSEEQQDLLRSEISRMEHLVENLREEVHKTKTKFEESEARCALLAKANTDLNETLSFLKNTGFEKVRSLEEKLKYSDSQLEHAKTSVEAIREQQNVLNSTLDDMENLIQDLKGKVSKAESRAESSESKCSFLAETNLELNEELAFLRGKLESLGTSLHEAEDAKITTAKDIGIKTKIISDLILKLALERERLQLQISSLVKRNKVLVRKCLDMEHNYPVNTTEKGGCGESQTGHNFTELTKETVTEYSTLNQQVGRSATKLAQERNMAKTVVTEDTEEVSPIATRNIEPSQLKSKCIFLVAAVVLVSSIASFALLEKWNH